MVFYTAFAFYNYSIDITVFSFFLWSSTSSITPNDSPELISSSKPLKSTPCSSNDSYAVLGISFFAILKIFDGIDIVTSV